MKLGHIDVSTIECECGFWNFSRVRTRSISLSRVPQSFQPEDQCTQVSIIWFTHLLRLVLKLWSWTIYMIVTLGYGSSPSFLYPKIIGVSLWSCDQVTVTLVICYLLGKKNGEGRVNFLSARGILLQRGAFGHLSLAILTWRKTSKWNFALFFIIKWCKFP